MLAGVLKKAKAVSGKDGFNKPSAIVVRATVECVGWTSRPPWAQHSGGSPTCLQSSYFADSAYSRSSRARFPRRKKTNKKSVVCLSPGIRTHELPSTVAFNVLLYHFNVDSSCVCVTVVCCKKGDLTF